MSRVEDWAACANVAAVNPRPWPQSPRALVARVAGAGRIWDLEELLAATSTTSLVVAVDGQLVYERYWHGLGPGDRLLGYSATKSALALLVGRAYDSGALGDLAAPVRHWVPELAGSGYGEVSVAQLASMTSGVDWQEDYRDPAGAASRLQACWQERRGGTRALLATLGSRARPGTAFGYATPDSLVLDWVRERATGLTFTAALASLWKALGAEHDALVCLDQPLGQGGIALAGTGLAATPRDWARLAWLQVDGRVPGADAAEPPLVSPAWVAASSRPGAEFLRPGRLPSRLTTHAGFGYHWWPLDETGGRVAADGMQGQFAYVDRPGRTVVVKTSAWDYQDAWVDRALRDLCYLALPAIARAGRGEPS